MTIIALIIFGIAAGFIATRAMRMNVDVPTTIAIGIGGALIGAGLLQVLAMVAGWLAGFVGAIFGAMALIWIYKTYFAKNR